MPNAENVETTCRVCYAKSLSADERDRFYGEPVTGCIHLCPEHQAAMDEARAALPPIDFIKAQRPAQPHVFPPGEPVEVDWFMCPECKQGKHQNCTGNAWDNEADALVACECGHG